MAAFNFNQAIVQKFAQRLNSRGGGFEFESPISWLPLALQTRRLGHLEARDQERPSMPMVASETLLLPKFALLLNSSGGPNVQPVRNEPLDKRFEALGETRLSIFSDQRRKAREKQQTEMIGVLDNQIHGSRETAYSTINKFHFLATVGAAIAADSDVRDRQPKAKEQTVQLRLLYILCEAEADSGGGLARCPFGGALW